MRYASPEQIKVLNLWCSHGPSTLDPSPTPGGAASYQRRSSLTAIRQLIEYWGMGPEYEHMRQNVHSRDITQISDVLRLELVAQARSRGLVMRGGEAPVPLFGMQMEVLTRLAWGATQDSLTTSMRISRKSAAEHTWRMRKETGCSTTAQLVACAYRHEWLPSQQEIDESGRHNQLAVFDADRVRLMGPAQ